MWESNAARYVLIASRIVQIVFAIVIVALGLWQAYGGASDMSFIVSFIFATNLIPIGYVGLIAALRPGYVYYRVTLTLDYMGLVVLLFSTIAYMLETFDGMGYVSAVYDSVAASITLLWLMLVATIIAIVRTHRLKKAGYFRRGFMPLATELPVGKA